MIAGILIMFFIIFGFVCLGVMLFYIVEQKIWDKKHNIQDDIDKDLMAWMDARIKIKVKLFQQQQRDQKIINRRNQLRERT